MSDHTQPELWHDWRIEWDRHGWGEYDVNVFFMSPDHTRQSGGFQDWSFTHQLRQEEHKGLFTLAYDPETALIVSTPVDNTSHNNKLYAQLLYGDLVLGTPLKKEDDDD